MARSLAGAIQLLPVASPHLDWTNRATVPIEAYRFVRVVFEATFRRSNRAVRPFGEEVVVRLELADYEPPPLSAPGTPEEPSYYFCFRFACPGPVPAILAIRPA
jgi:hypothetical protein